MKSEPAGPYDARAVANYILDLAQESGVRLTQLSLMKIVYFAHGWYLASNGQPLISQSFEAWQYGPVVRVLREEFKAFGNQPISTRAKEFDLMSGESTEVTPVEDSGVRRFLRSIFIEYGQYDGWILSQMTHEPGSPWDRLWNSDKPVGRLALRLKNEDIREHFRGSVKRNTVY